MTLDKLHPGERGTIRCIGGQGALRYRLLDMGLTPGTPLSVSKVAPLGDPIEIHIRGYELTMRLEDAALIALDGGKEDDICACRQPEQRKNHAFQHSHRREPACGKLPGRHGRSEKRRDKACER